MRVLWWCLSASLMASGPAVWVIVDDRSELEARDAAAPIVARFTPTTPLPLPQPRVGSCGSSPLAPSERDAAPETPALEASLLRARQELAAARVELQSVQARLQESERKLADLVEDRCQERFQVELDAWLDGSLEPVYRGESHLRGQLRRTLEVAAGASRGRGCVRQRNAGCPEDVASLRLRITDGVVAQLADLYRGWNDELASRPRFQMGCGNSPTVTVEDRGHESEWPRDHPYVLQLHDELTRISRAWQSRINALIGAEIYELE